MQPTFGYFICLCLSATTAIEVKRVSYYMSSLELPDKLLMCKCCNCKNAVFFTSTSSVVVHVFFCCACIFIEFLFTSLQALLVLTVYLFRFIAFSSENHSTVHEYTQSDHTLTKSTHERET